MRRVQEPLRSLVAAPFRGEVLERERAQQPREGGRGGDAVRHLHGPKIRAQQIELILRELEAVPQRHVRGVENDVGLARLAEQIRERLVFEDPLVVQLGGQVDPVEGRRGEANPVDGRQRAEDEVGLDIAVEKRSGNPRTAGLGTARSSGVKLPPHGRR